MARIFKANGTRLAAKLLIPAALVAIAFQFTGLPAKVMAPRAPEPVVAKPVPAAQPAPVPRAVKQTPAPAPDTLTVKRILDVPTPFRHGDYVWDDAGVPAGPLIITVDLKAQTLSVFRGGYEIGAAVILYGADNKPTPLGVFPITQKDADHVSTLYDAPMPYMLRLTNDGVAIHGSGLIANDRATHGCIGVPVAFAKLLFAQAKLGDRVIVTNGQMMDQSGPTLD